MKLTFFGHLIPRPQNLFIGLKHLYSAVLDVSTRRSALTPHSIFAIFSVEYGKDDSARATTWPQALKSHMGILSGTSTIYQILIGLDRTFHP
jgi:hypothetical protein